MFPPLHLRFNIATYETKGRPIRYEAPQCVNYLFMPVGSKFDIQYFQSVSYIDVYVT
jgi:hypothetical protein